MASAIQYRAKLEHCPISVFLVTNNDAKYYRPHAAGGFLSRCSGGAEADGTRQRTLVERTLAAAAAHHQSSIWRLTVATVYMTTVCRSAFRSRHRPYTTPRQFITSSTNVYTVGHQSWLFSELQYMARDYSVHCFYYKFSALRNHRCAIYRRR